MKINKEEAIALWLDGKLDTEIAKHFNCSKECVCTWRKKNDLPSNRGIFSWGDHKDKRSCKKHERRTSTLQGA